MHFRDDLSRDGCSVADWECVRATSYLYTAAPLGVTPAAQLQAAGFEIALHLNTSCSNSGSLDTIWNEQLPPFLAKYTGLTSPRTSRTHCIPWNGWIDEPLAELAHGVRLDTNYYYYPPTWALVRPGLFTGSGFPMRFADSDGEPIDVYQAATQITDEWGDAAQGYPSAGAHIDGLLNGALGPEGYYGVFTANMHTDTPTHAGADQIIAKAKARGVPVVSAAQMLDWLDGRDGSSFRSIGYSGGRLTFTIARNAKARGLQAMVPARSATGALTQLTRNGAALSINDRRVVKGIEYVVFDGAPASYAATYGSAAPAGPGPTITKPPGSGTGVQPGGSASPPTPKAKLAPGRVGVTDSGRVRLRVTCPLEERCSVQLKLTAAGKTLASRLVQVRSGATRTVRADAEAVGPAKARPQGNVARDCDRSPARQQRRPVGRPQAGPARGAMRRDMYTRKRSVEMHEASTRRIIAAALAVAAMGVMTATAQAGTVTDDLTGGDPVGTIVTGGGVELKPAIDESFDGALPASWQTFPWTMGVGSASVAGATSSSTGRAWIRDSRPCRRAGCGSASSSAISRTNTSASPRTSTTRSGPHSAPDLAALP